MKRPVILTVIDGLGLRKEKQGNAFALAKTPTFDEYFKNYPHSVIQASENYVGLPKGQMGNSEVGHLNIGAGFVVYTGLSLINKAVDDKTFGKNEKFLAAFENSKKTNTPLQIMGLLSPGGVHSLENHLFELLESANENGVKKVLIHLFGDGRDVAPQSILSSLEKLNLIISKYPDYKIGSIAGRFYSMDRDKMFDRVEKGYNAILGMAENTFENVVDYVNKQYNEGIFDEFLVPAINSQVNKNDFLNNEHSVIFFNFRPDRARQLSHLILGTNLYDFNPKNKVKVNKFVSMMKYEGIDTDVAFEEVQVTHPIGKVIEGAGLTQLRLAETQKYAHVTFFMDGGNDVVYKNSERIMVPSLKVESYADAPQMSAKEITDQLLEKAKDFDLVIMNFANPDMVGHTGNLKSAIKAVEVLDEQLARIKKWVEQNNAVQFITADHGNAEVTEDENQKPATKHTSYPVMLITTDKSLKLKDGKLANIAPTILDYMKIEKPESMNEESLIIK
ncbi:2,3-bisphosphoglycerate-independent phosphoglycerate mutase [Mesomycoplasma lagogenitalium]|uniref:2,3-bisphosphoglycerate-independent phosphoglycerate mutase n=1 Tax=Mesomycoplasma lagogenitalium TaxID=171286 RepID=A0ABY8LTY2_9BACT|nr:2,3-bisphosphoglycerate-independent phosphoglycerate mutase [Mesomycoplasma lagogenitalium]WGI36699.1 2,3-bisphosphoglycerate-independent phosphoglycerate mutase [Mesomycoplasma lagogenitalium]